MPLCCVVLHRAAFAALHLLAALAPNGAKAAFVWPRRPRLSLHPTAPSTPPPRLGHQTAHFNVGNYRRKQKGESERQDANFFDAKNQVGARVTRHPWVTPVPASAHACVHVYRCTCTCMFSVCMPKCDTVMHHGLTGALAALLAGAA